MHATQQPFLKAVKLFLLALAFVFSSQSLFSFEKAYANELSVNDIDIIMQRAEEYRRQIASTMEEATVFILVPEGDSIGMGTGFVVADNYILTNAHVVEDGDEIYLAGKSFDLTQAELIDYVLTDEEDFALLKFNSPLTLPILSFNREARRTERVSSWGYPYLVTQFDKSIENLLEEGDFTNLPPLVYTEGFISSFVNDGARTSLIHSADIAGGNSGGPLINAKGQVVGVNTWGATEEDEGAIVNAALLAEDAIAFLRSNGIEPRISDSGNEFASNQINISSSNHENFLQGNNSDAHNSPTNSEENNEAGDRISSISQGLSNLFTDDSENQGIGSAISSISSIASSLKANDNDFEDIEMLGSDYSDFAKELYPLAQEDDADAQAYLGFAYYVGEEAPYNPQRGIYLLEQAALQNNADAQTLLGTIYITDFEYKNTQYGLDLVRKGAEANPTYASILAELLLQGFVYGIPRDEEEAAIQVDRGVEVDDIDAIAILAYLLKFGIYYNQDLEKAYKMASYAAEKGSAKGKTVLGYLYIEGSYLEEDIEKGVALIQEAANEGDSLGMGTLAMLYLDGEGLTQDYSEAYKWAMLAADEGNELGFLVLGKCYLYGLSVETDTALAMAYLQIAANIGVPEAQNLVEELETTLSKNELKQAEQNLSSLYRQWGLE